MITSEIFLIYSKETQTDEMSKVSSKVSSIFDEKMLQKKTLQSKQLHDIN